MQDPLANPCSTESRPLEPLARCVRVAGGASLVAWLLACGSSFIEGERVGGALVQTCADGRYDPARLDAQCDVELESGSPAESRDLAAWRPPEQQSIQVERRGHHFAVRLSGVLACEFEADAARESEIAFPPGTRCRYRGRELPVENGYARGEGGTLAPTHVRVTAVLSDGPGVVLVSAPMYPPP